MHLEGEFNESALTDHCNKENHTIALDKVKILHQENKTAAISTKCCTNNLNHHEGTHYLSTIYHFTINQSGSDYKAVVNHRFTVKTAHCQNGPSQNGP